jgi:hypothetical protein
MQFCHYLLVIIALVTHDKAAVTDPFLSLIYARMYSGKQLQISSSYRTKPSWSAAEEENSQLDCKPFCI